MSNQDSIVEVFMNHGQSAQLLALSSRHATLWDIVRGLARKLERTSARITTSSLIMLTS